jgi:hypothetical protein
MTLLIVGGDSVESIKKHAACKDLRHIEHWSGCNHRWGDRATLSFGDCGRGRKELRYPLRFKYRFAEAPDARSRP